MSDQLNLNTFGLKFDLHLLHFDTNLLKVACLQMINALVATPDDLDFRLHLRNEIIREGFSDALPGLREMDQDDLNVQLDIFDEHKDDDAVEFQHRYNDIQLHMDDMQELFSVLNTVVEDTPSHGYFLSILQHLLLIRDDVFARPQYFRLIEECVSQIVLQKQGVDPDFAAQKLTIDVDSLVGKYVPSKVKSSHTESPSQIPMNCGRVHYSSRSCN